MESVEAAAPPVPHLPPFDAVVTVVGDHIVAASQVSPPDIDTDHTFFSEIMKFCDEEKDKVTKDAIEFFSITHGLDFSKFEPEGRGQRQYQNATMYPFRPPLDIFAHFSLWKESDIRAESKWFHIHVGGYVVSFSGEQKLYGRYGGEEGKLVRSGDLLSYQFFNIPIDGQQPVVFRIQTFYPVRREPVDQHTISNMEVFHDKLGKGRINGAFQEFASAPEDPKFLHVIMRAVITFPDSPADLKVRSL